MIKQIIYISTAIYLTTGIANAQIAISEILPNPTQGEEYIEIVNTYDRAVDLYRYSLSDGTRKYIFPKKSIILPEQYLAIPTSQSNIKLSKTKGESILLRNEYNYPLWILEYNQAPKQGTSIISDLQTDTIYTSTTPTPNKKNKITKPKPEVKKEINQTQAKNQTNLKINEILANAKGIDKKKEYIELYLDSNTGYTTDNYWKIGRCGSTNLYQIPENTYIPARGYMTLYRTQTNITMPNDKGSICLYYDNKITNNISYTGTHSGYSKSKQTNGQWKNTIPTPAKQNSNIIYKTPTKQKVEKISKIITPTPEKKEKTKIAKITIKTLENGRIYIISTQKINLNGYILTTNYNKTLLKNKILEKNTPLDIGSANPRLDIIQILSPDKKLLDYVLYNTKQKYNTLYRDNKHALTPKKAKINKIQPTKTTAKNNKIKQIIDSDNDGFSDDIEQKYKSDINNDQDLPYIWPELVPKSTNIQTNILKTRIKISGTTLPLGKIKIIWKPKAKKAKTRTRMLVANKYGIYKTNIPRSSRAGILKMYFRDYLLYTSIISDEE